MKKRPIPIPLIAAFVLLFVIVGYINFKNAPVTPDQAKQTPPPDVANQQALGDPRAAPGKDALLADVKTGTSPGGKPGMTPPAPGGPPNGMGPKGMPPMKPGMGGPPAGMPLPKPNASMTPPKPKPSDSQISGQWYDQDSDAAANKH
jgi:hypothetical protein